MKSLLGATGLQESRAGWRFAWSAFVLIGLVSAARGQTARTAVAAERAEAAVVRAYPCAAGCQNETAAKLRAAFAGREDVRVAADPETGRLLVLAPPNVHEQIARQILPAQAGSAGKEGREGPYSGQRVPDGERLAPKKAPETFSPTDGRLGPVERFVPLVRSRPERMETTLRELFGPRIVPLGSAGGGVRTYQFAGAAGRRIEIAFDPRRSGIRLAGTAGLVSQFARLVRELDAVPQADGRVVEVIPLRVADPVKVQQAVEAYRTGAGETSPRPLMRSGPEGPDSTRPARQVPNPRGDDQSRHSAHAGIELASYLFQPGATGAGGAAPGPAPAAPRAAAGAATPDAGAAKGPQEGTGEGGAAQERLERLRRLVPDVEIEVLPDLDAIILRGRERDVQEVKRLIEEIERLSAETQPVIEIYPLKYVEGEALSTLASQIHAELLGGRQGRVSITPLVKPNALLLIGWGEAVKAAKELIAKLDQPVSPETQQRVFRLKHASATAVQTTVQGFFQGRTGLGARVRVTADARTNSLVVDAAPRDLAEVALLVERLDTDAAEAVLQTRIFKLQNTLANDVYATLQGAIDAARGGGAAGQKSAALELLTVDPKGQRLLKSGILNDVRITPDVRLNTLIVATPADSMDLLAALIHQLDSPGAVAQIKVFRVTNGDANALITMLRTLLPSQIGAGPQISSAEGESSIVPLRFSADMRTNSIIAVGSPGDLKIIEALLLRLDMQDAQQRKTEVYRLKNSPANDVALAVNDFLRSQRQVQLAAPGAFSPFAQLEAEVIVVPEPVSNSLIISATPRFFEEIMGLVEKLDAQPPQVMIQVLIATVTLSDVDQFGVELGLQDSVLFNRSLLDKINSITNSQVFTTASGVTTVTQQEIVSATNTPGYNFNNQELGNSGANRALLNRQHVGGQGLSNFSLGRTDPALGYGGLVLSASSESVSVLIRALQESQRLEVLGRPQIMTLDNQAAFIQIGKRVPRITGTQMNQIGQTNTIDLVNVGLILGVTPRISPEGMVVMEIDAEKSDVGPEAEGVPVSVVGNTVIRSPSFDTTMAQTTVSAQDGETIVLGGLITRQTQKTERKVPYLGDVPVLGNLFKYRSTENQRSELLIILTPHVVRGPEEAERIKRLESARMHWCLADVYQVHGDAGFTQNGGQVIYPDANPRGLPEPDSRPPKPAAKDKSGKTPPPPAPGLEAIPPSLPLPELEPVPPPKKEGERGRGGEGERRAGLLLSLLGAFPRRRPPRSARVSRTSPFALGAGLPLSLSPPLPLSPFPSFPLFATLLCLVGVSGCASWDLTGAMPWSSSEPKPQTPSRIADVWTDTILYQPGRAGVRGFGGRVMFYGEDGLKTMVVDGTFTVMAFDDSDGNKNQGSAEKKFVFLPQQLPQHYSKSELGHSYSFWLPWDEVGGAQRKICLVCRFEPRKGNPIVSQPSHHTLPGDNPQLSKAKPAGPAVTTAASPAADAGQVQQASYETPASTTGPREPMSTLTIDVPPSFARPGVTAEGALQGGPVSSGNPRQGPTFQRPDGSGSSTDPQPANRAAGSAGGAALSTRSAPSRFPAQRGPTALPRYDPVRRQPLPATWPSRLPPTPRSGWSAGTQATPGADEPKTPPPAPPSAE